MKIRTKLMLVFALFIVLVLGVVSLNYRTYLTLDSDANFVNYAGRLRANSYRMAHVSANIVLSPENAELKATLEDRIQFFDNTIKSLIEGNKEIGLKAIAHGDTKIQLEAVKEKWDKEFRPTYLRIADNDNSALEYITKNIDDYVSQIDKLVTDYSAYSQTKVAYAKIFSIIFIALAIILGLISLLVIRKGIIAPINAITEGLREISTGDGDLTKELRFKGDNEIGQLTKYFNQFVVRIREIIILISKSSGVLSDSMGSISQTSEELSKTTEMIAMAIQDVSAGSIAQSAMTGNLNKLVEAMDEKISNMDSIADRLLGQSEKTKISAHQGISTVNEQVTQLEELVKTTVGVSSTVDKLERHSDEIQNILSIIDSISKQTNLLALNASIEAARAGDAGRGFAVVADEIRNLASETAKSTISINALVNNITAQTTEVKNNMDVMVNKINAQSSSMNEVVSKLDSIFRESEETYNESKAIGDINMLISKSFTELNQTTDQISEVIGKNSQNTQDVAAAVEEQTASFQEVSANLTSLNEMSKQLKEIVAKFKV